MNRSLPALLVSGLLAACADSTNGPLQGYAEGEYVRIAAPFAGTLVRLDAARGARVQAGSPLFALEAESETAARREAEASVRAVEARLENLRKGRRPTELEAIEAQLAQADAAAAFSAKELRRREDLVAKGFVSHQALDEARTAVARDTQKVAELKAQLATARLGSRPDEIRGAEAELAAAREALAQADWRLRQKSVAASVSGTVTDTLFTRGEWVGAGAPVVALLPPENVKVRFFVPEPRLGAVKVGQGVKLACDGCPGAIAAKVSFIAPQAEYTPPVIYSRENRAKLVFLVEARTSPEDAARLHPGQPVEVSLE